MRQWSSSKISFLKLSKIWTATRSSTVSLSSLVKEPTILMRVVSIFSSFITEMIIRKLLRIMCRPIQPLIDMIEECDAVIFSIPCFQGHLPGIMKNFTDHMAFMLHRPRYFKKKALIISTTGGVSAQSTTKALAATLPGWGFNKCYQLPITALSWNDYKPTEKDMRRTYDITKRFYLDVKSGKAHVPGVGVLIPFNLFQAMCIDNKGEKEYPTEDNNFWPKYKGMRYAPGIPMTPFKRVIGWLIYQIGKKLSQTMVITYRK